MDSGAKIADDALNEPNDPLARLERAGLLVLADRPFRPLPEELPLFSPEASFGQAKSASYNPATGEVRGAGVQPAAGPLMARYAVWAAALVREILPAYGAAIDVGRTSFRWRDAADPSASPRKDDRRLHADAFASQPTGGRRLLRVFSNVNPAGEARIWRIGEAFEDYARRWVSAARRPWPGEALLLHRLRITRETRSLYDFLMLGMHDAAKLDPDYQRTAPRREIALPSGASWICFTDSLVHAALSGRYALEQTFYLPVSAMAEEALSPLRILERLTGRALA
ncbi:MAG: Kdo hydroxylase family protein [Caulobacteraceae bacterium]